MRVLLATTNRGKMSELSGILAAQGIEVMSLGDLASTEEIETAAFFTKVAAVSISSVDAKSPKLITSIPCAAKIPLNSDILPLLVVARRTRMSSVYHRPAQANRL